MIERILPSGEVIEPWNKEAFASYAEPVGLLSKGE
jgi:hypothetical protein